MSEMLVVEQLVDAANGNGNGNGMAPRSSSTVTDARCRAATTSGARRSCARA